MNSKPHIDPQLAEFGDTRNVVDRYKAWTVSAIKTNLEATAFPLHIAIENILHDFNIGTIVRNANAFNVSGVHIIGKRHWNRRGAMSTEKYLTVYHHKSIQEFIEWAGIQGLPIIGIDNVPGSRPLNEVHLPQSCVLVFGQEGPGLSAEMQSHCCQVVAIEQFGSTRSINVGVASGIIMYTWLQHNHFNLKK